MFKFTPNAVKSAVVAAALAMSAFSMSAQATPVTWTFNNATLKDTQLLYDRSEKVYSFGVAGSFTYDADNKTASNANFNIDYSIPYNDGGLSTSNVSVTYDKVKDETEITFTKILYTEGPVFKFAGLLSNAGGTKTFINYKPDTNSSVVSTGTLTSATSNVSAVPVPAAAWLFGSSLVGLVGLRRRKQVA